MITLIFNKKKLIHPLKTWEAKKGEKIQLLQGTYTYDFLLYKETGEAIRHLLKIPVRKTQILYVEEENQ